MAETSSTGGSGVMLMHAGPLQLQHCWPNHSRYSLPLPPTPCQGPPPPAVSYTPRSLHLHHTTAHLLHPHHMTPHLLHPNHTTPNLIPLQRMCQHPTTPQQPPLPLPPQALSCWILLKLKPSLLATSTPSWLSTEHRLHGTSNLAARRAQWAADKAELDNKKARGEVPLGQDELDMKAALDARAALAAQRVGLTPEEKAALLQRAEDSRRTQEGSSYQFHAGLQQWYVRK
eukprot:jgi/Chrzof1/1680/Cz10g17020.t1